jgi:hypothetical protein
MDLIGASKWRLVCRKVFITRQKPESGTIFQDCAGSFIRKYALLTANKNNRCRNKAFRHVGLLNVTTVVQRQDKQCMMQIS